jgi:hypothetical protein
MAGELYEMVYTVFAGCLSWNEIELQVRDVYRVKILPL